MTEACFLCRVARHEVEVEREPLRSNSQELIAFHNHDKSPKYLVHIVISPREHLVPLQSTPVNPLIWGELVQVGRQLLMQMLQEHGNAEIRMRFKKPGAHLKCELIVKRK